jgi:hypothetical protein
VFIDKRLAFIPHVNYAVGKGKMVTGQLSPLTCRRSKMSIKNKLVLYKSVVLPTMIYASVAWGHVSETQLPMLKELLLEIANKTFEKAKEHENPLVREAVDYDETGPSRCKRPKMVLNG